MFRIVLAVGVLVLLGFWFCLLAPVAGPLRDYFGPEALSVLRAYAPDFTLMVFQVVLVSGVISGLLAWNLDQQWRRVRNVMRISVEATLKRGLIALKVQNHDLRQLCNATDHEYLHDHPDDHHDHDVEHHTDPALGKIQSKIAKRRHHFEDLHDDMYMMLGALQSSLNPKVAVVFANSTEAFRQIVSIARVVEVASQRVSTEDHGRSAKAVERRLKMVTEHVEKIRTSTQSTRTLRVLRGQLWLPILAEVQTTIGLLHEFSDD